MEAPSVGELFRHVLQQQIVAGVEDLQLEAWMGDEFGQYLFHQTHSFDLSTFFAEPDFWECRALAALMQMRPDCVLDVGAGSGRVAKWLQAQNVTVTACEPDPGCAVLCREAGIHDVRQCSFGQLNDRFAAAIVLGGGIMVDGEVFDVPHHLTLWFDRLQSVLVSRGWLALDVHNYDSLLLGQNQDYKVSRLRFRYGDLYSRFAYYVYPHRDLLRKVLAQAGFGILQEWTVELPAMGAAINHRWLCLCQNQN